MRRGSRALKDGAWSTITRRCPVAFGARTAPAPAGRHDHPPSPARSNRKTPCSREGCGPTAYCLRFGQTGNCNRLALRWADHLGQPKFFSQHPIQRPSPRSAKESACGCAASFQCPPMPWKSYLCQVFEQAGAPGSSRSLSLRGVRPPASIGLTPNAARWNCGVCPLDVPQASSTSTTARGLPNGWWPFSGRERPLPLSGWWSPDSTATAVFTDNRAAWHH